MCGLRYQLTRTSGCCSVPPWHLRPPHTMQPAQIAGAMSAASQPMSASSGMRQQRQSITATPLTSCLTGRPSGKLLMQQGSCSRVALSLPTPRLALLRRRVCTFLCTNPHARSHAVLDCGSHCSTSLCHQIVDTVVLPVFND